MLNKLTVNIKNNFLLYRRSRLLIILGIILLVFYGLTSFPQLIVSSFTGRISGIAKMINSLNSFSSLFLIIVLLVGLNYPLKNRCLKMIITKPCTPEIWLLSNYISSIAIALIINVIAFLIACLMFAVWDIGFQLSLVYIFLDKFLQLVLMLSYISFLMMVFGIWGSVIFGIFLTEGFFYYISNAFSAWHNSVPFDTMKIIFQGFHKIFYFIYLFIPILNPFSDETGVIYKNFKIDFSDWKYLLYTLIYTLLVAAFFYLVNGLLLRRKRMI